MLLIGGNMRIIKVEDYLIMYQYIIYDVFYIKEEDTFYEQVE